MSDRRCNTCNASTGNNVNRVIRCGLCFRTPSGNTQWRPITIREGKTP